MPHELWLSAHPLGPTQAQALYLLMQTPSRSPLLSLRLHSCQLACGAVEWLALGLQTVVGLRELEMPACGVGPWAVKVLSGAVGGHPTLSKWDLAGNLLGNDLQCIGIGFSQGIGGMGWVLCGTVVLHCCVVLLLQYCI